MYDPDDFLVTLPYEAHKNPPEHYRYIREQYQAGERIAGTEKAFMASDREIREAMALTCGMIAMIDDVIGELQQVLKKQGLDENTIIVFNTYHGDYMGDFNLLLKGPAPTRSVSGCLLFGMTRNRLLCL
jgi:arylsulfatase A-like enzyme